MLFEPKNFRYRKQELVGKTGLSGSANIVQDDRPGGVDEFSPPLGTMRSPFLPMSPPLVTVTGLPSKSDTARQQEASKLSPLIAVAGMLDCFNISFTAVQIRSQILFVRLLEDAVIMLVTSGDSVLGGGRADLVVLCDIHE